MPSNEGRVYFALDGDDFEPDELTCFLGIQPTSIKRKSKTQSGQIINFCSWQLSTENIVREHIDVFKMSQEIVNQLKPKQNLIIEAKSRFNIYPILEVVLWLSKEEEYSTPAIGFEVDTLKFLGEIGTFIDIDTYIR